MSRSCAVESDERSTAPPRNTERRSRSPETTWAPVEIRSFRCGRPAAAGAPPAQPRSRRNPRGAREFRSAAFLPLQREATARLRVRMRCGERTLKRRKRRERRATVKSVPMPSFTLRRVPACLPPARSHGSTPENPHRQQPRSAPPSPRFFSSFARRPSPRSRRGDEAGPTDGLGNPPPHVSSYTRLPAFHLAAPEDGRTPARLRRARPPRRAAVPGRSDVRTHGRFGIGQRLPALHLSAPEDGRTPGRGAGFSQAKTESASPKNSAKHRAFSRCRDLACQHGMGTPTLAPFP